MKELSDKQKARKIFGLMDRTDQFDFPSKSQPGRFYRVIVKGDGSISCNCRGWTIKKDDQDRWCRHTRLVERMLSEKKPD